ncbi:MAG: TetR/AcrR family transcriptional regulator [Clostridia bacterium]|nr:TetR/AcrR family transcriptional regulator [Clostridia bacterium]
MEEKSTKIALLQAGIREIRKYGLSNMSMRRVALNCELSCATPYKHFKNKDEFIIEVFNYIHQQWSGIHSKILEKYPDTRQQIIETCIAYIKFLVDNPDFRSILFAQDETLSREQRMAKSRISHGSLHMINAYCESVQMPLDVRFRKTYVVRSLLYGAAFLLGTGELEESEETYGMIRVLISREFDIE